MIVNNKNQEELKKQQVMPAGAQQQKAQQQRENALYAGAIKLHGHDLLFLRIIFLLKLLYRTADRFSSGPALFEDVDRAGDGHSSAGENSRPLLSPSIAIPPDDMTVHDRNE